MSERDFRTMFCWFVGCLTGGNIYIYLYIHGNQHDDDDDGGADDADSDSRDDDYRCRVMLYVPTHLPSSSRWTGVASGLVGQAGPGQNRPGRGRGG